MTTFKYFANHHNTVLTDGFVFYMTIIYSLGSAFFRTIWGYLFDRIGFKPVLTVVFSMEIILASTFYFIVEYRALVVIYFVLISSISASTISLVPSSISKVFGIKYGSEVLGIISFSTGIASILSPILSKILNLSKAGNTIPYLILYEIGAVLACFGLAIVIFKDMSEYQFEYYDE